MNGECSSTKTSWSARDRFIWYFYVWFMPLANHTGTICSGLCFVVLLRHRRVFASSTRAWFLALTASDFLILLFAGNDMYAEVTFPHAYHYFIGCVLGPYTCIIRLSTIVGLLWSSNLLQAGLSLERLISILAPLRSRALLTGRLARFIITGMISLALVGGIAMNMLSLQPTIFAQLANSTEEAIQVGPAGVNLTELDLEESPKSNDSGSFDYGLLAECRRRNISHITKIVYHIDLIVFRAIPFATMLISSGILACLIRSQSRRRNELVHNLSLVQRRHRAVLQSRESRASLLLLAMNATALLTNPLFLIFELWDGEASEGHPAAKLTGDVCVSAMLTTFFNFLMYFNNQTNWIFYLTFGARFRRHIQDLVLCRCCEAGLGRRNTKARIGGGGIACSLGPSSGYCYGRGGSRGSNSLLAVSYSHTRPLDLEQTVCLSLVGEAERGDAYHSEILPEQMKHNSSGEMVPSSPKPSITRSRHLCPSHSSSNLSHFKKWVYHSSKHRRTSRTDQFMQTFIHCLAYTCFSGCCCNSRSRILGRLKSTATQESIVTNANESKRSPSLGESSPHCVRSVRIKKSKNDAQNTGIKLDVLCRQKVRLNSTDRILYSVSPFSHQRIKSVSLQQEFTHCFNESMPENLSINNCVSNRTKNDMTT
ncbi:unnamed protein product [Protopolystoma xenopodis]|uniref:G-protein coupled receptors family 1 profile domain-containing protein n=1 Tax=Protopolystoma xenopodis TaxID=117903 RepID=A0A3S4ZJY0_9PLAT|nr:unnamed protein product [Protopolystoma xenopodis]